MISTPPSHRCLWPSGAIWHSGWKTTWMPWLGPSPLMTMAWSWLLSRPICDTILKRLEGPTKDRTAYWNAFARWISLHQHYIKYGDTYKWHTMPHDYNNTLYTIASSDYGWNTNRNSNDIHPASPGCRPGTYPLIKEEAEELQNKQTSLSRHEHCKTCTCNCCCSNL